MKHSKLLCLVLALVFVLGLAAPAMADGLSAAGEYPIWTGDEPYVLKVLVAYNAHVSDWDDNTFTKWVEEKCNVDLQFEFLPEVEPKQKLIIDLDTNEELPDVVIYGLSVAEAYNYGSKGKFVNLKEFFDEGVMVQCDSAVERFPTWNLITNITNSDGSIYAVPKIQASPQNETKYKLWINKTYLDNLGLEMPTTTDELYDMLVAFRDNDANGDGDPNDEIPLLGSPSSWGSNPVKFLTNAFVAEDDRDMWLIKDGHVEASYTQDEWFDALEYLKKLADE
ncbi:MAG: extracellular solute-binding protein, partial [Clostridia bacterium]|nr:extracellular solute-binding protein [Clostridia bacterium]